MDAKELALLKMQWHIELLQALFVKGYVDLYRIVQGPEVSEQEAVQPLLEQLSRLQQVIYQHLLSPEVPEDRRVLVAEEFAQLVDEMKASLASTLKST